MKNLSLKKKLLIYTLGLISTSFIIGIISFFSVKEVINDYGLVANINYPKMNAIQDVIRNSKEMRLELNHLMFSKFTSQVKEQSIVKINDFKNENKIIFERYLTTPMDSNEQNIFNKFKEKYDAHLAKIEEINNIYNENKNDDLLTKEKVQSLYFLELEKTGTELSETGIELNKMHEKITIENVMVANKQGKQSILLIAFCILGISSISAYVGYKFSSSLENILKRTIEILSLSSGEMSEVTKKIAKSSGTLSQTTTKQASLLQETTASVEEMNSMIGVSASNAKSASEQSKKSRDYAIKGREVVSDMIQSMSEINQSNTSIVTQVESSSQRMQEIVGIIQEIESKTKIINDIVFQTKLLSFNASVEAARAGEQGKGFAVVAEEVGNLAEMSGKASKEISDMLSTSIAKVQEIVGENQSKISDMTNTGKAKIEKGIKVAEKCGTMLTSIVNTVSEVTNMADQIADASQQQSQGIAEVNKAMVQLDQITLSNSTTARETAQSTESLNTQASHLTDQINILVKIVNGSLGPTSFESTRFQEIVLDKKIEQKKEVKNDFKSSPTNKALRSNAIKEPLQVAKKTEVKKAELKDTQPDKVQSKVQKEVMNSSKLVENKPVTITKTEPSTSKPGPVTAVVKQSSTSIPSYDHPGFEDV